MNFNNEFLDRVGRILDGRKLVEVDYWYLTLVQSPLHHIAKLRHILLLAVSLSKGCPYFTVTKEPLGLRGAGAP